MALSQKRIEARKLRKQGESILYIARKLEVAKSSVSSWCSDITLTNKQIEVLMKRHKDAGLKGRLIGAQVNKQKKIHAILEANIYGEKYIKKLSERELVLTMVALYWAEGSKSDLTSGFQFVNSDPEMIQCMKICLGSLGIKKEDLVCTIQINESHRSRITKVLSFWKNLLEFTDEQVRKPTLIKSVTKKKYENHDSYFGICRLQVRKSTVLKYKMLGLIKALKNGILHVDVAQLVRASHS